jgi:tetratricopeptide (TPR) repeat protein
MTANRIIQHIFREQDLSQVEEAALERLVADYPYFTAARLLLAQKHYSRDHNLADPVIKRAQLYSNNHYYFYQQITGGSAIPPAATEEEDSAPAALPQQEMMIPEMVETEEEETEAGIQQQPNVLLVAQLDEAAPEEQTASDTADDGLPIKIFPLEMPDEETTLIFQPLYTEDYFAYKKIKEPGQAEELNEQGMADMKSFTDWLRDMKRSFTQKTNKDWYHQQLHRIYEDEDPEVSEAVEKMAMESITLNDDIVSETLAEIWAKQHQYQTAIQIYQKLSLLNPDKSAYFAQKIKELQLQTDKSELKYYVTDFRYIDHCGLCVVRVYRAGAKPERRRSLRHLWRVRQPGNGSASDHRRTRKRYLGAGSHHCRALPYLFILCG